MRVTRRAALACLVVTAAILVASGVAWAATFRGNDNPNTIEGTDEADTIYGEGGGDTLYGRGGSDEIRGGGGKDKVEGNADADRIYGGDDPDEIDGGDGIDYVEGNMGGDTINGEGDGDTLRGGNGVDTIGGGPGDDTMDGGDERDRANYGGSSDGVTVDLQAGEATGEGTDTLTSIADVTGSTHADDISGHAGNNDLDGGSGDDTLSGRQDGDRVNGNLGDDTIGGGPGNDNMIGSEGTDRADYGTSSARVQVDLGAGTATGEGTDTLSTIEDATGSAFGDGIDGSTGNNDLDGGSGNDTMNGDGADDTLSGNLGDDGMNGNEGTDRVHYGDSLTPVQVDLQAGTATGEGNDTLTNVEDATGSRLPDEISGSAGKNDLEGNDGDDTISGKAGDDTISGNPGDDNMSGDGDTDRVDYSDSSSEVQVDLEAGTATGEGNDTLATIEDATGSKFDDTIAGSSGRNDLDGKDGRDNISGGGDEDNIEGNEGADELNGDGGKDAMRGGTGDDTIRGGDGDDDAGDVQNDKIDGLYGSKGADTIYGGPGNDRIVTGTSLDEDDNDEDEVYAGEGDDFIDAASDSGQGASDPGKPDRIHCGGGQDKVRVDDSDTVDSDCELVHNDRDEYERRKANRQAQQTAIPATTADATKPLNSTRNAFRRGGDGRPALLLQSPATVFLQFDNPDDNCTGLEGVGPDPATGYDAVFLNSCDAAKLGLGFAAEGGIIAGLTSLFSGPLGFEAGLPFLFGVTDLGLAAAEGNGIIVGSSCMKDFSAFDDTCFPVATPQPVS